MTEQVTATDPEKASEFVPAPSGQPPRDSDETLCLSSDSAGEQKAEISRHYDIVDWEDDSDPNNPLNWSPARKWACIGSISFSSCAVTCCSSMITSTYDGLEASFRISREVATLTLSLFVLALGIGPLLMGPLSELYGRRPIYLVGYFFFTAFQFAVAFGQNIGTLLVARTLLGFAGSAFLSVAGGSVADCFRSGKTATPMTVFTTSVFFGPVLGPVFASAIVYHQDWRVVWYFQIAWCGASFISLYLLAPETLAATLLAQKAKRLRRETGNDKLRTSAELHQLPLLRAIARSCYTPFALLCTEPMATLLCLWTAVYLAIIYGFFGAFEVIYSAHGFNGWQIGESFWGVGIGTLIGALSTPIWTRYYDRRADEVGGPPPPEELLRKGIWGGIIAPLGLIVFAFTCRSDINWSVSVVFSIFFGLGYQLIFMAVFSYLVAAYRPVAASAMALNSFLRSSFAAGFPLGIVQMYEALGVTWASALIAFVALALAPVPIIFFRYGHLLRKKSKWSGAQ